MKYLDHLEEWIITFLIGAATLVIFVAVMHRYAAGLPIPGVLPGAAACMLFVGVLASWGPARRGLRIDPTDALRGE